MNRFFYFFMLTVCCVQFPSCNRSASEGCRTDVVAQSPAGSWKDELKAEIPLLGHRNWIVVTDMAYPLQTQPGIKTVYTQESYGDILDFVCREIEKAPHIKAAVYQDRELLYLDETDAPGIDALREQMQTLLGDRRTFVPHETLIDRLDEVSRKFTVTILKSNLTVPYTSTFFELDCNYWDGTKEKNLQQSLAKGE